MGEGLARAKQQNLHMRLGFPKDAGNFGDCHVLDVFQPKGLELDFRQVLSRQAPEILSLFPLREQARRVVTMRQFRDFLRGNRRCGAVVVNAFPSCDGEEPTGKGMLSIKLVYRLESFDKSVLGDLESISPVAAGLEDKRVDPMLIAIDQLFKSRQRTGLALADQSLVGSRLKFRRHACESLTQKSKEAKAHHLN